MATLGNSRNLQKKQDGQQNPSGKLTFGPIALA